MAGKNKNKGQSNTYIRVEEIKKRLPSALNKNKDPKGDDFFYCAEETGKLLADNEVSVTQIRKIFNETKKIKYGNEGIYRLRMLKAIIAYTAKRFEKQMKEFKEIFSKAIDIAEDGEENLERFKDFFEAVIAYHRAYGGKE
ncbi:MAG: type III-A CRISPR-associated protein Csm2 [Thermosediminibacteraceae bacterium]|nr:type III-A CRISPR-associated protein Csm2 [Thermosediminibacteraceae bacterium]